MVKSKRSRIIVLTIWALIVCGVFVGFHRSQQKNASEFLDTIDETVRLNTEINKPEHVGGSTHDLTNDPGEPFSPEKEYKVILSEAPGMQQRSGGEG
jgi:hypothetical protein